MTVTISRLYDSHPMLSRPFSVLKPQACRTRRSASSPTIRIAGSTATRRWIATATASTIAPKVLERAPVLARASAALPACSPAWACLRSPASDLWLLLVGWLRLQLVQPPAQPPAALSERSPKLAFRRRMLTLYAEGVRRGGTLVSAARVADADRSRLDAVLNQSAVNLRDRSAAWQKAGWKSFDFHQQAVRRRGRPQGAAAL